jgi:hypothetical protein
MDRSVDRLCDETIRLRERWDMLRPRLDESLRDLHLAAGDYVKLIWQIDAQREALRNARLSLNRTRIHRRDICEVFSKQKPQ